jgi:hypothetical protein
VSRTLDVLIGSFLGLTAGAPLGYLLAYIAIKYSPPPKGKE